MALQIPTFVDPSNYRLQVELDGTVFGLSFLYNTRDSHWYVDVLDADGNQLRSGIKLTTAYPLLSDWAEQGRPIGELLMIDPTGRGVEAARDDINVAVFLTYIPNAELP